MPTEPKRVLVVFYSQTGQLARVLDSVIGPLDRDPGVVVHREPLRPVTPYPFPWKPLEFLDVFPETVALEPPPCVAPGLDGSERFDLVVLGYTVWYLSPAPPVTGFLQSKVGRQLLAGRPVVTVTACRNMWLTAHETVTGMLRDIGARHCDHVVLTDQGHALATFVTTPRWMLTGRKDSVWGLPAAGVAEEDVRGAARFGEALREALRRGDERRGAPMLRGLRACVVDERLIASERIGKRSFNLWRRVIRLGGPPGAARRKPLLLLYVAVLVTLIVTVVPLGFLTRFLLRPFNAPRLVRLKRELEAPSGSETYRLSA